jgi:hypothetical protein
MAPKKYEVPELAKQIERMWASELATHFGRTEEEVMATKRPWFDFELGWLRIELMDGSAVDFRYAFHLVNEEKRAIAVFTEHCGNHLYPNHEAKVFRDGVLVYEQK